MNNKAQKLAQKAGRPSFTAWMDFLNRAIVLSNQLTDMEEQRLRPALNDYMQKWEECLVQLQEKPEQNKDSLLDELSSLRAEFNRENFDSSVRVFDEHIVKALHARLDFRTENYGRKMDSQAAEQLLAKIIPVMRAAAGVLNEIAKGDKKASNLQADLNLLLDLEAQSLARDPGTDFSNTGKKQKNPVSASRKQEESAALSFQDDAPELQM